jgi:hypothetical protein
MVRSPITWFVLLVSVCLAGPYLLGAPPRSPRDWTSIALTARVSRVAAAADDCCPLTLR